MSDTVQEPGTTRATTEYVVLRHVDGGGEASLAGWRPVGTVPAANADAAIRKAAGDTPGTYVATPARSWNPRTLKVETTPRVSLS